MLLVAHFLILLSLPVIVIQDFKQRQISWFLIPLALTGFICKALLCREHILTHFLINFLFISVQLIFLTAYFSIKNKKLFNIIDTYLGLGDVLFFLVLCTVFSPLNFIAFYIISLIITLAAVLIYNFSAAKKTHSIPLAGAMAAGLILLIAINWFYPQVNFYDDTCILNLLPLQ